MADVFACPYACAATLARRSPPMVKLSWYVLLITALLVVELLLADLGVLFPGAFALCFYVATSVGWRQGLLAGMVLAICVETLLGRHMTIIPGLLLVLWGARIWRGMGAQRNLSIQVVPGLLMGLASAALVVLGENLTLHGDLLSAPDRLLWLVGGGGLAGALGVPVAYGLADSLAGGMGLDRYSRRPALGGGLHGDHH